MRIPLIVERPMAGVPNDAMTSTCLCFDALISIVAVKTHLIEGENVTLRFPFPPQHVTFYACNQEETHYSSSTYTFTVVHLFFDIHIHIEYEITDDEGICTGTDQPRAYIRILSHVMSMNVNCLEEANENPPPDVGESVESNTCEGHYDADDEAGLSSGCSYNTETEEEESDRGWWYDDCPSDYMYEPYDPYNEEGDDDPIPLYDYDYDEDDPGEDPYDHVDYDILSNSPHYDPNDEW